MSKADPCRVVTPEARLSYPYLFEKADPFDESGEGKYQTNLIFAPGTDLSKMKAAASTAARKKWGTDIPKNLKTPFRSGTEKDKEGYPDDCTFIAARSGDKPGVVVGPNQEPCLDPTEVYAGCYVRVSVTAFAWTRKGVNGVSFALNNVWKIRDGEPFGDRRSAEEDFAEVEVDSEAWGETAESLL